MAKYRALQETRPSSRGPTIPRKKGTPTSVTSLNTLPSVAETQRCSAASSLDPRTRVTQGQFFTPWAIAELMASMSTVSATEVRLLDAGAGTGILAAAWIYEACNREVRPERVSITAFETDSSLLDHLRTTLDAAREAASHVGLEVEYTVRSEDFVLVAAETIATLGAHPNMRFNAAILNPPYRKIRSDTDYRRALRSAHIETSNLYTAFVGLALPLLKPGGELVAITPRSFCNGPYFRPFRKHLLLSASIERIHVFEARDEAFADAGVLQENVVLVARRGGTQGDVVLSVGNNKNSVNSRTVPFRQVVYPNDPEVFIHADVSESEIVTQLVKKASCSLADLGVEVSTGRVVDFRARDALCAPGTPNSAPLIYPHHFENGYVQWPRAHAKKKDAILVTDQTRDLLVPAGFYVLVRRFSAKEERRRVVAALFDPAAVASDVLAFENHLNFFHKEGRGLEESIARGLCAYLNSTVVDAYFRQFSGHTQVNATDLRNLPYLSVAALERLADALPSSPSQDEIDSEAHKTIGHSESTTSYLVER